MTWWVDVRHEGLGKFRRISGADRLVVEEKARLQIAVWDRQWQRLAAAEDRRLMRERTTADRQAKKEEAAQQTAEAQKALAEIDEVLAHTLTVDDKVDWDLLKNNSPFPDPRPLGPNVESFPPEPRATDPVFLPVYSFWDKLSSSRRQHRDAEARKLFEEAKERRDATCAAIQARNDAAASAHRKDLSEWERKRDDFLACQRNNAEHVDLRRNAYEALDPEAIVDYCDLVLSNSSYPDWIVRDCQVQYVPETKLLVVDCQLPSPGALPTLKEVKYVQARDAFDEIHIPESSLHKLYDELVYQITLRTLHELFEADAVEALDSIAYNGWVQSIDPGTGKEVNACIVTIHVRREEFLAIDLAHVEPKACFKSLKGVGSSKLHGLAAVAPIIQMNRDDKRFVASHEVVATLEAGTNLAVIEWEDFEHLVRELFEKEFALGGGEVKVTRASRDGGVDAVAFDPDPIRGGKVVIQAKRYTNTVGVSAVRDLYGTVLNEGATKGILVTTSDYGPDAYDFAKGKPLTLLNGANLLHLLEKHGHRARIDLQEAKKLATEDDQ